MRSPSPPVPRRLRTCLSLAALCAALLQAAPARTLEVLSVHELAAHCAHLAAAPEGADAQYCLRYIQGFIDGAVATDAQVMLGVEGAAQREESFTERALRTRLPSHAERSRAAQLAGFCLGSPLPLSAVVAAVVGDLRQLDSGADAGSPARDAVYRSLQAHFPCEEE